MSQGGKALYNQGSGWTQWPPSAKDELVLEWFQDLMKRLMVWVTGRSSHLTAYRQIHRGPNVYLDGSPIERKMDVGIAAYQRQSKKDDNGLVDSDPSWAQSLVTGEMKSNPIEDGPETAWLDLATYVREVFRKEERRFVLGFTLCGSIMRLWQFDRRPRSISPRMGSGSFRSCSAII